MHRLTLPPRYTGSSGGAGGAGGGAASISNNNNNIAINFIEVKYLIILFNILEFRLRIY